MNAYPGLRLLRDRRPQREGRVPGPIHDVGQRVSQQLDPDGLPVPKPGAEPGDIPASGVGDGRSHDGRTAFTRRIAGRLIVSACRARSATIRRRATVPAEGNGTQATSRFNAAPITLERTEGVEHLSGYLAPGRRRLRRLRQRQDGREVQSRALRDDGDQRCDLRRQQPEHAHREYRLADWADTNRNFAVDCDLLNPAAQTVPGGDTCGALTGDALNFGKASGATRVNPALLTGWGVRPVDWQWGINLAQELAPRVSLEVGYNKRWWGNYTVTDNTLDRAGGL